MMKYQEIIGSLPKKEIWNGGSYIYEYEGFWFCSPFLEGTISVQESFQAQPGDIVLCSAMKTGTTWLKALAFAIVTRNRFDVLSSSDNNNNHPLFNAVPHDCVPFLEVDLVENNKKDPEMPLLSTHLPFSSLPKCIISKDCKMVYICRDPKDTFVSYWHFLQRALQGGQLDQVVKQLSLEKEFEMFCDGSSIYGPYWDHVLGYWKASIERPDSVLFLKRGVVGDWKNLLTPQMQRRIDEITDQKLQGSGFSF
nr:flavonol sulfotransferase-like [Ipomoea batatas]